MTRVVVGISGASGAVYAVRLVELLLQGSVSVDLTATDAGLAILREETGLQFDGKRPLLDSLWGDEALAETFRYWPADRIAAPIASGSLPTDGMVVCPCSMNSLGAMAAGLSGNLLQRAALVTMKEGRRLVVVPRETPLAAPSIEAMLRLVQGGAVVLPACPGFYHQPTDITDLVDFVVARILDVLCVPHDLAVRWQGGDSQP